MKQLLAILSLLLVSSYMIASENKIEIDKSFQNITEVVVDVVFCKVDIKPSDGADVTVKGHIQWEKPKYQYEFETQVKGTTLYVKVKHPRKAKGRTSGIIELTMPSMTDIDISTVSGNISAEGIGQRSTKFNTISGNIKAHKIGSKVKANTISGNIYLSDVKGHVNSSTISGNHYLEDIDGNLKGSSISGDFQISNLKGNREISTISGSIR